MIWIAGVLGVLLGLGSGSLSAQESDAMVNGGKPPEVQCKPDIGCVTNLPLPRFVSLKGSEGNARRGPGLTHRIDWVFTRAGMPLRITAEYENWRRVEDSEGAGGWVHYSLLSGVRTVLVTLDMAELHDAPDDSAPVVAQAELGVVGRVLECNLDWCRLSMDGTRGWILKSSLWGVKADEIIE
jgi:SH3-like domain-containing protein